MATIRSHEIEILLVEDNPGDVRLTQEALREARVKNNLSVMTDGAEALDYLRRRGRYADSTRPDLILLDLNLPKVGGREVLRELKQDPDLKVIPVVVLTSSDADFEVDQAYKAGANSYITKPVAFDNFLKVIRSIEDFWLSIVRFPPRDGRGELR